jgi:hypothetical protein
LPVVSETPLIHIEQVGWDGARIMLGHRQVSTTRIYALDYVKKAAEAMAKCG